MGLCFSNSSQFKTQSPYCSGSIRKDETTNFKETDGISNRKVSSLHSEYQTKLCCEGEILQESHLRSFTFAELKGATRNFRPGNVPGEDGFGYFFKGCVDDDQQILSTSKLGTGMVIAVKRLKNKSLGGRSEWLAQLKFLGQLYHPNLVKLIGYCLEDDQRFLVHEFIPRGSLENHLFMRGSYFQPLSWNLRLKVAFGAAKGLAFLHSPEANTIHADFKTSSILLDSNYNAKLSDFGLAKEEKVDDKGHIRARVIGNHEYSAPEYVTIGYLCAKGNVYSFGVVLLEILSGRRALDRNRPIKEINLVEWAKPYLANKRKVVRVLDNRLEGQYTNDAAHKAATLALRCLSTEAKFRPTMYHVAKVLEELHDPNDTSSDQTRSTRRRSADDPSQAKSRKVA